MSSLTHAYRLAAAENPRKAIDESQATGVITFIITTVNGGSTSKLPVASFAVKNPTAADIQKMQRIVFNALSLVGYRVIASISDSEATQDKVQRHLSTGGPVDCPFAHKIQQKHNVSYQSPLKITDKIYMIPDPPHRAKCRRNRFANSRRRTPSGKLVAKSMEEVLPPRVLLLPLEEEVTDGSKKSSNNSSSKSSKVVIVSLVPVLWDEHFEEPYMALQHSLKRQLHRRLPIVTIFKSGNSNYEKMKVAPAARFASRTMQRTDVKVMKWLLAERNKKDANGAPLKPSANDLAAVKALRATLLFKEKFDLFFDVVNGVNIEASDATGRKVKIRERLDYKSHHKFKILEDLLVLMENGEAAVKNLRGPKKANIHYFAPQTMRALSTLILALSSMIVNYTRDIRPNSSIYAGSVTSDVNEDHFSKIKLQGNGNPNIRGYRSAETLEIRQLLRRFLHYLETGVRVSTKRSRLTIQQHRSGNSNLSNYCGEETEDEAKDLTFSLTALASAATVNDQSSSAAAEAVGKISTSSRNDNVENAMTEEQSPHDKECYEDDDMDVVDDNVSSTYYCFGFYLFCHSFTITSLQNDEEDDDLMEVE